MHMDILNNHLDEEIRYILKSQVVSRARKQAAWERLQQAAAQQVILAPYAVSPKGPQSTNMLLILQNNIVNFFVALCTDESSFQKAASSRQGRYGYAAYVGGPYQSILNFSSSIQYAGIR